MALTTSYYSASGKAYDDCAFLGQRFDEESGYKPNEGECWICSCYPGPDGNSIATAHRGTTGWLTQLWRSPSGAVYVSSASGVMHMKRDLRDDAAAWDAPTLDAALFGVWGLDDRWVVTWGTRGSAQAMLRWDGKRWSDMPAPPFSVRAVHGIAPELLYAVGVEGGVARWDGTAWRVARAPTREILVSVFVAGPDEIYAVGNQGGVLEGSGAGWARIAEAPGLPGPLAAVAKYKGELWLGAGQFGLFRRIGKTSQLDCVKPKLHATGFDTRAALVISCDEKIAGTEDNQDFYSMGAGWLLDLRAGHPLCDF